MDTLEAIRSRRRGRKWLPQQVPDELAQQILDAGRKFSLCSLWTMWLALFASGLTK